ncbi:MAG: hypothetical protein AMXMBFR23_02660 [Chloroflexota bacterium]
MTTGTHGIVLNSLSDLVQVRDRFPACDRVPESMALVPVIRRSDPETIAALTATAREALDELQALVERDRIRRDEAARGLDRWREIASEADRVGRIAEQMRRAADEARSLTGRAFDAVARDRARAVADHSARLATQADAHAASLCREVERLAGQDDIRRLLAEERSKEEEMEVRNQLALAGEHLDSGAYEEARRLLTSLERSISGVPDLVETFETLQKRAEAVKVEVAEQALREGRRLHRREPVAALDLLEPLELDGLPEELARHLYGLWLTACRRIGLLAAVHYRTGFGRGAVLMPTADGQYEVVSAIGLRRWERGRRFAPQALRGARPLA